MPFQVKKDTRLAPEYRQKLSDDQKERLDSCVNNQDTGFHSGFVYLGLLYVSC
jgi:hypothetical protein